MARSLLLSLTLGHVPTYHTSQTGVNCWKIWVLGARAAPAPTKVGGEQTVPPWPWGMGTGVLEDMEPAPAPTKVGGGQTVPPWPRVMGTGV